MTSSGRDPFPASALAWLAPDFPSSILGVGRATASTAGRLLRAGHRLTLVDRSAAALNSMHHRLTGVTAIAATADALPFIPCAFDAVIVAQGLHLFAPGLALAEFARVLVPGGRLGVQYTVRDDSVPWVRRLAGILQAVDPHAMSGDTGVESTAALASNPYFPAVERHDFRMWVPMSRDGLLEMVAGSPRIASLDDATRGGLLGEVGALYDGSTRASGPLLLPYRVACWRAVVDHSELSAPLALPDDGLRIRL